MKISANNLLELLQNRHERDLTIAEAPVPPWGAAYIDFWALKKSWARPLTTGYEIKVSRSDFLRDEKWRVYLEFCDKFFFVAPPNLIDPRELPEEAGLLVCSKNCTRLYTKKAAQHRQTEIPENFYRSVLINRARITSSRFSNPDDPPDRGDYWSNWLERKGTLQEVGWRVSQRLQILYEGNVQKVESENDRLKREIEELQVVEEILLKFGIKRGTWRRDLAVQGKLNEIKSGHKKRIKETMGALQKAVNMLTPLT